MHLFSKETQEEIGDLRQMKAGLSELREGYSNEHHFPN